MPTPWNGNSNNPAPNPLQKGDNVSEINTSENRAFNTRRDQDVDKNFTVKLLDIDGAIFDYMTNVINIQVIDNNSYIKVPLMYASPEKWKAIQKDGVLRDQQGKLQIPIIVFKRTTLEKDVTFQSFNRHQTFPFVKKFSEKNKYDQFSVLNPGFAPTNQVYAVTIPDYVTITYEFNCWTEYVEQMNAIIEKINFAAEEYWGDPKRFKFRAYINDYSYTTENPSEKDRMVRASFSLEVHAYLLAESFEDRKSTVARQLTPRVIRITSEVVSGVQMEKTNADLKTKVKPYPFTYKDGLGLVPDGQTFKQPIPTLDPSVKDISGEDVIKIRNFYQILVNQSKNLPAPPAPPTGSVNIWHDAPATPTDPGQEGWMAYDGNFHYIYVGGIWRRKSIADWSTF